LWHTLSKRDNAKDFRCCAQLYSSHPSRTTSSRAPIEWSSPFALHRRDDTAFWRTNQHELKKSDAFLEILETCRAGLPASAVVSDTAEMMFADIKRRADRLLTFLPSTLDYLSFLHGSPDASTTQAGLRGVRS
jgi:hypothetical protein